MILHILQDIHILKIYDDKYKKSLCIYDVNKKFETSHTEAFYYVIFISIFKI